MSHPYWKSIDDPENQGTRPVNEDWALPVALYTGEPGQGIAEVVSPTNPMPITVVTWGGGAIQPARRIVSAGFNAAAAGDYAAADVVSNSVTDTLGVPLKFAGVVDVAGQVAILDKIVARCSEDSILARFALDFYTRLPLAAEVEMDDNIAADPAKTVAGYGIHICRVPMAAFADFGTAMSESTTPNLREMIKTYGSVDLYAVVIILDAEVNETAAMRVDIDTYWLN